MKPQAPRVVSPFASHEQRHRVRVAEPLAARRGRRVAPYAPRSPPRGPRNAQRAIARSCNARASIAGLPEPRQQLSSTSSGNPLHPDFNFRVHASRSWTAAGIGRPQNGVRIRPFGDTIMDLIAMSQSIACAAGRCAPCSPNTLGARSPCDEDCQLPGSSVAPDGLLPSRCIGAAGGNDGRWGFYGNPIFRRRWLARLLEVASAACTVREPHSRWSVDWRRDANTELRAMARHQSSCSQSSLACSRTP